MAQTGSPARFLERNLFRRVTDILPTTSVGLMAVFAAGFGMTWGAPGRRVGRATGGAIFGLRG